jgi:hypothetical protein
VVGLALGKEHIRPPAIEKSQYCVHILAKAACGWSFEDLNATVPQGYFDWAGVAMSAEIHQGNGHAAAFSFEM